MLGPATAAVVIADVLNVAEFGEKPVAEPDKKQDGQNNKLLEEQVKQELPTYGFIFYFFACFFIVAAFSATCVCVWSSMGIGEDALKFFSDEEWLAYVFAGALCCLLSLLYFSDFFTSPHIPGKYLILFPKDPCIGKVLLLISLLFFIFACLFCAKDYPSVPLMMTIFLSPACVLTFRISVNAQMRSLEDAVSTADMEKMELPQRIDVLEKLTGGERDDTMFYRAAMLAYLLGALITLGVWLPWAFQQEEDFKILKNQAQGDREKEVIYILWSAPVVVATTNVVFFLLILMRVVMARSYEATNKAKNNLLVDCKHQAKNGMTSHQAQIVQEARLSKKFQQSDTFNDLSEEKQNEYLMKHSGHLRQISRIIKIIGCAILFMLGSFYAAAELVAADSHIALMFQGFLGAFFITFFVFVFVSFRRLLAAMSDELQDMPLFRMAKSVYRNDWIKAIGVACAMPLFPAILLVSVINQCIRKCRGIADLVEVKSEQPKKQQEVSEEISAIQKMRNEIDRPSISTNQKINVRSGDLCLTQRIHTVVESMRAWDWLKMTGKLYVLGLLMVVYVLSPRMLNIFLAWLNSLLSELSFGLILVMVWLVGMCCFLLPPVPGVPVYIFGGMIIADQCPQGFWVGVLISIGISFIMKLCACAMQQKLIGEALGTNLSIRQTCGIHKPGIRAIECVLRQEGWTIGKVAILCGGPDWPTSVMAGVLRLNLCQMELGTIPIIFFIAPCVMTGSFYLKQEESEMWSRSGTLMMTLTMVVNIVLWGAAGWAIQNQFDKNHDYITRPMEKYLELDWLDYKQEQLESCNLTFEQIPGALKFIYVICMIILILVGHAFYWRSTDCFGEFAVTDDVKNLEWTGDDGIFKMPGLIGCIVATSCCFGWLLLSQYTKCKTSAQKKEMAKKLDEIRPTWEEERRALCQKSAPDVVQQVPEKGVEVVDEKLPEDQSVTEASKGAVIPSKAPALPKTITSSSLKSAQKRRGTDKADSRSQDGKSSPSSKKEKKKDKDRDRDKDKDKEKAKAARSSYTRQYDKE